MNKLKPVVDYRKLRFSNLNSPEFSHLWMLLYWPLYGLAFLFVERLSPIKYYFPVYSTLDDLIPFCELFLIPYWFWFLYLIGMHLYTLLYDIDAFRGLMKFIIISYTIAIVIYLIFPTCQQLRPVSFERDNILTRMVAGLYAFDTSTNVCPSIHVIGSVAVLCASWHVERFRTPGWKFAFGLSAFLISISTVFLKQHSVIDILAAIPVCVIAYYFSFMKQKAPQPAEATSM